MRSLKNGTSAIELAKFFGYLTPGEVQAIKQIASSFTGLPTFVNIGAGSGTSSMAMSEGNPRAKVFTVDCSSGSPYGGLKNEYNAFKHTGIQLPVQILETSHNAARAWPKAKKIDFVFVDDGHQEPEVRGDIEGWLPHMKEDGIIAFHDYGSNDWPHVKMVVDELMSKFDKFLQVDTLIAFKV